MKTKTKIGLIAAMISLIIAVVFFSIAIKLMFFS
jgi:hypothetical protein